MVSFVKSSAYVAAGFLLVLAYSCCLSAPTAVSAANTESFGTVAGRIEHIKNKVGVNYGGTIGYQQFRQIAAEFRKVFPEHEGDSGDVYNRYAQDLYTHGGVMNAQSITPAICELFSVNPVASDRISPGGPDPQHH